MALTLVNENLVWQNVKAALNDANPPAQAAFAGLKAYLANQKKGPLLQFIPFSSATAADPGINQNTGYSPIGVPAKVLALYIKKQKAVANTTPSFIRVYDAADNATLASALLTLTVTAVGEEAFVIHPEGHAFATDVTISGDTGAGTGTESAAVDNGNGFIIVAAA